MANKREFKKELNNTFGEIIEEVMQWQALHNQRDNKDAESIIDDAITYFDELIVKVNQSGVEDKSKHFNTVRKDFEEKQNTLYKRIEELSV